MSSATRWLTYDLRLGDTIPKVDEFLVSITRSNKEFGSLYHIVSLRKVVSKKWRWRWRIEVLPANELLDELRAGDSRTYRLRGAIVHPLYWTPRKKRPS